MVGEQVSESLMSFQALLLLYHDKKNWLSALNFASDAPSPPLSASQTAQKRKSFFRFD